jgi:hypothetical protein
MSLYDLFDRARFPRHLLVQAISHDERRHCPLAPDGAYARRVDAFQNGDIEFNRDLSPIVHALWTV